MPDLFVTRAPHWDWHAVVYFLLGGLAGGSYALASLAQLFGRPEQRAAVRAGHLVAFPAVVVGAVLLTLDLTRPERFWHMLFMSERPGVMLKPWSPMSLGAWALLVFGAVAFLSFVGAVAERRGRPAALAALARGVTANVLAVIGSLVGLFVAGYTGVLLSVTNRPLWAETPLLGTVFLFSAVSTSAALLVLLARREGGLRWLTRLDAWILALELVTLVLLVLTLGPALRLWANGWGVLLVLGVGVAGILVPLFLHAARARRDVLASALVLVGGLLLRAAIVLSVETA